jgi:SAM-dependent methyltransferase
MKLRDSGMPDEAYWETLFDVPLVLERLGIDDALGDVVELGCGYGTFSIPVAQSIRGALYTFDIDPAMVARTEERAATEVPPGKLNCEQRDVAKDGFGVTGNDAALVFNLLHCKEPVALLQHAVDAVRPEGLVLVMHWRYAETPRGPSLDIRPRPEQIVDWAEQTGRLQRDGDLIDMPAPTMSRKIEPSSIDQSVRASWAIFQKPCSIRIGSFVVAIAVSMMATSGSTASRVNAPASTNTPQPISNVATSGAVTSGDGMPILANRPAPTSAGYRNF